MLSLISNSNTNQDIRPESHGLYKLDVKRSANIAVASKPVFGASITFHSELLTYESFIAKPENIIGWVDMRGLSYFSVCSGQHSFELGANGHSHASSNANSRTSKGEISETNSYRSSEIGNKASTTLPSQFITVENGILRFTSALRIYLLAKTPKDIHQYGLCYFTPV
ncbi:hypothetical protein Q4561_11520 [Alteromonas sp. 1_MG-2023]|uniref:hypothetical protein n=1 Tax=Alteromonas sp. 1_MG-2023 TaxID=3062669 RepID=UPI0026E1742C|nr:hypothetical protein [Alteromonas sp. 1_MG-2023]MDO6567688.1 hypothetical protein [Alteromonas sp. 1_MG-2023]